MLGAVTVVAMLACGYGPADTDLLGEEVYAAVRVPTPVISPASGAYPSSQMVTVSNIASGDTTYCALNARPRRSVSQRYAGPFAISAGTVNCQSFTLDGRQASKIVSATYSISSGGGTTVARLGMNLSFVNDYNSERFYADAVRAARTLQNASGQDINIDPIQADSDGQPKVDFNLGLVYGLTDLNGTYRLEFTGQAATIACGTGDCTVTGKVYDSGLNKTTASVAVGTGATSSFVLTFRGTKRLPADADGTGATNIHLWRPESPGSATSFPGTSPFALKKTDGSWTTYGTILRKFSALRFMDVTMTNNNQESAWADRVLPSWMSQSNENQKSTLGGSPRGISWEHVFAFANEVFSDAATVERGIWINVPLKATDAYVLNLARTAKCGSDGVNPWVMAGTSVCAPSTPTYAALNPNIKVYIEYSNEVWNWGFGQAHDNQDAMEQAILDRNGDTIENFDGIVPTAAETAYAAYSPSTTYSRGALVEYLGFAWSCNINTGATITGVAPGSAGYTWNLETDRSIWWRRVARKAVEISNVFRSVFGDSQMMTRIRPVLAIQGAGAGGGFDATSFLFNFYDNGIANYWPGGTGPAIAATAGSAYTAPADGQPHPPSYYFYAIGGAPYIDPQENGGDLANTTNALTTGNMIVSNWQDEYVRPVSKYASVFGLKHVSYEGGPGMNNVSSVWDQATQIKAPAVPNMTDAMVAHQQGWEDMGGDLFTYYALGGDKRWNFLPYTGTGGAPNVFSADSAKLAAVDAVLAVAKRPVANTYSTAIPGTATTWEFGYTSGWYTLTGFMGSADGQTNWLAYMFRADTARGSSTITLSKTGTGTAQVYVDGVAVTASSGDTVWTGPALSAGLHGVIVRAVSGTFTLNSVTVN